MTVAPAHDRFPYSPITRRQKVIWPNGARIALWVIPNIEHFHFDKPATPITLATMQYKPDVLNYGWRDYGNRVGVWRMMEVMDRHGIRGTAALNSEAATEYPQIIAAGNDAGWEWMGHGTTNSSPLNSQSEPDERALITTALSTIEAATGRRPRGWLGPALSESVRTPDLLAEAGIDYVGDWTNDEQPYEMTVAKGRLFSMPYSIEVNDIPVFLDHHRSAEDFERIICDQFDVLYEDGAVTGRVMAIALHPFLIGHPYRAKYLDRAFAHIRSRQDVWVATGSEILDAWRTQQP